MAGKDQKGGKTSTPQTTERAEKKDPPKSIKKYHIVTILSGGVTTDQGKKGKYWNVNITVYHRENDGDSVAVPAKVKVHDGIPPKEPIEVKVGGTDVLLPASRNDRAVVFSVSGVLVGNEYVDIDVESETVTLPGVPYEQIPQRLEPDELDDPPTAFWKGLLE